MNCINLILRCECVSSLLGSGYVAENCFAGEGTSLTCQLGSSTWIYVFLVSVNKSKTNTLHLCTSRLEKKHFEIKNSLVLISNINEALSPFLQHSNSPENNFILTLQCQGLQMW